MEEKLTPEEIQKILEEHELWLDSDGNEGKRADLSGKNLEGANLKGVNLKEALCLSANLIGVNLVEANLEKAALISTNLMEANLEKANLKGVDLGDAILERANLLSANLEDSYLGYVKFEGATLRESNLRNAYLRSAKLEGADLRGANLEGASFELANLEGANLQGTNRNAAKFLDAYFGSSVSEAISLGIPAVHDISLLTQNLHYQDQQIQNLQNELALVQKSDGSNKEQVEKLNKQIESLQLSKQQTEKMLQQLKDQNEQLKNELSGRINDAKESLENALKNTDIQIQSNRQSAKELGKIAKVVLAFVALALFIIPVYIWLSGKLPDNNWHIVFYTFPILTLMLIATTLLRHQKALLNEVCYFSAMKHQIELYSGLLEASQHAAASMGDTQKANEYVQETFTQIRNRLLSEQIPQDYSQPLEGKEDLGSDKIINLLDKVTNPANKRPS
ncbi:MAG: pentapeptide repeat-containing protein [Neisseria zoodegmatis]|uniref:pentapeptide repeat-containing protein n=1 Tax=Neisseria zoodegmatis TaxID=326523 RepID=UPI0026EB122A|nr:pentapeptide repeat-containing protein [Neisseria zoodegmatis]MDO5069329.1 pentapeptide repeat-containing protein [Neisseria zoodegmatis]